MSGQQNPQQACKMYLFLLLSLCVTLCCGHYDAEDWTDPTDMFNYDAATGKMKHNTEEKVEAVCEKDGEDTCLDKRNALVINTEISRQVTEEYKNNLKSPESNSNPVFRRYLRKMLNEAERFGLPEDSSSEVYYNAEMVLTKQMVVEIQKFIDDEDWNVGALEDALTRTLVQFRFQNVKEWWTGMFEDYLGIDIGTTFKIVLCITCIVSVVATELWTRIGWFTQIKRLCILSFIVSVGWNWMYLYKVAFAERQAELTKMHKFDGSCGEKISWSESLFEWWKGASTFQNDPCEEYFKALMISPALMVPPTKALALTFTDFITEPLKHVGKAIGEFLKGLLSEIPVFYQLLVLILIAVIIIASCYGATKSISEILVHRNHGDTQRERLPPAEPQRPRYGNVIEGWHQQPYNIEPQYEPLDRYPRHQRPESLQAMDRNNPHFPSALCYGATKPIGEILVHRNHGDTQRERLPPAEPQRPRYGNVIEGWHQQPYNIEPQYEPLDRYPRHQRPESLQAMDRNNPHFPSGTEVDSSSKDKDSGHGQKMEFTEDSRGKTDKPVELSSSGKQRKEELPKDTSDGPSQSEKEQRQRKEDPIEQKSLTKNHMTHDSPLEITNSTQQGKAEHVHKRSFSQEQMVEVETLLQNTYGEHQKTEEPLERSSSQLQGRKDFLEDTGIMKEGHLQDKLLELKGDLKKEPSEQKMNREEVSTGCEAPISS
ncbi:chloride channel CLIC-like protein 1 isoform X1 [Bufo bufo]|uniref:chloride channel CLIC-like protein 1 isoform X1 n=1 Tax=Bufo bufo TaxID=8384 RepID=UPI001ABE4080|nr:chloride channel CLIC-like protein 1 isoform X1 [Bufo bufo]